jgi:thioesterase domain-containing protein
MPLVLVPSHQGHALPYVSLVRHLRDARPIHALDVSLVGGSAREDATFACVAREHAAALRAARLDGPYLLAGFCFGAAMAYEVARHLVDTGDGPVGLYLLGVSPHDFPGLVPPWAEARWAASMTPADKVRRAFRFAAGMRSSDGRAYLVGRMRRRARFMRDLADPTGRQRHSLRRQKDVSAIAVHGRYLGPALPLPMTLILPSWSSASYGDDPEATWQSIGSSVAIHLVPGVGRMMLAEPVVARVAEIMASDPGASSHALTALDHEVDRTAPPVRADTSGRPS